MSDFKGFGIEERTLRLKIGRKGWAWIYDNNGEVKDNKLFDDKESAQAWMKERTKDSFVVQTKV